jgi:hypothetical protein
MKETETRHNLILHIHANTKITASATDGLNVPGLAAASTPQQRQ